MWRIQKQQKTWPFSLKQTNKKSSSVWRKFRFLLKKKLTSRWLWGGVVLIGCTLDWMQARFWKWKTSSCWHVSSIIPPHPSKHSSSITSSSLLLSVNRLLPCDHPALYSLLSLHSSCLVTDLFLLPIFDRAYGPWEQAPSFIIHPWPNQSACPVPSGREEWKMNLSRLLCVGGSAKADMSCNWTQLWDSKIIQIIYSKLFRNSTGMKPNNR